MGKLISEGDTEFEGEKIHYMWYRNGRLPNGQYEHYVEAYYDEPISIDDHGYGLDHAIGLLKMELSIQKNKRKLKK